MDSIPSIMLIGALLLFSAFFSASETALTSANKLRLRSHKLQTPLQQVFARYDEVLSTVIIGNTIVNIAIAIVASLFAMNLYGTSGATIVITLVVVTAFILLFGEILPKSLAKQYAETFLQRASASLMIILKICSPLTWLFVKVKNKVSKNEPIITDEDVKLLVDIGEEEGVFDSTEKELLQKAMEFDDIVVKNILTPRLDVIAVAIDTPIEEVKRLFIEEKFSRIPVYEGSIDNIVGVLSYRDFFTTYVMKRHFTLEQIMRKPFFVNASAKISNVLEELQNNKVHLAIVLDEFGGTLGIVTMEDIFEEVFGEIFDEYDENEVLVQPLENGKYVLNGRFPIEEFSELTKCELPETNSVTLSGWITETLGYLPKKGETFQFDHFTIYIEEVRNRRIQKVILQCTNKQTA